MKNNPNKVFDTLSKASHYTLWLDFKHRKKHLNFVVCKTKSGSYSVYEEDNAKQRNEEVVIPLGNLLESISYEEISEIAMDHNPLYCWQEIRGFFSCTDSEILRFVLDQNISLEQFIRFELASREYDKNGKWVGYEKAKEIWLE